ncbi:MAG: permease [Myxococcota bacterium]
MGEFLLQAWDVMLQLSPWLLLGAGVAGLLHGILPDNFIQRHLSGRGGVWKAVLFGVPLPLCSCGVIPAGIGLKKDGASDGASIGFLTATPQTGVDSIMVSAGMLGWPFALAKVGAAVVTGVVSGTITDALRPGTASTVQVAGSGSGARPTWAEMVAHALDLIREIWRWLAFGVLLSAALTVLLPADAFVGLTQMGIGIAFAAALLFSLPLYVCATASVPIAAALVASGMPMGAAMVFLMAGPATNVATLGAVYRTFGARTLGVYLTTIIAGSAAFGLGYEALLGDVTITAISEHAHVTWWSQLSAVVLLGLMGVFAAQELQALFASRRPPAEQSFTVAVEGMSCNGCANKLQRHLLQTDGVQTADVKLDDKTVVVTGLVSLDQIHEVVDRAGFTPA